METAQPVREVDHEATSLLLKKEESLSNDLVLKANTSKELSKLSNVLLAANNPSNDKRDPDFQNTVQSILSGADSSFVGSLYAAVMALMKLPEAETTDLLPAQAQLLTALASIQGKIANEMNKKLQEDADKIKGDGDDQSKITKDQVQYSTDQKKYDNYLNTWGSMSQGVDTLISSTQQSLSQILNLVGEILSGYGSVAQLITQI